MEVITNLKGFVPLREGEAVLLSGKNAWSKNEHQPEPPVKLTRSLWYGTSEKFTYRFPVQSATMLQMQSHVEL
jgi:hypothetical protein